MKKILLAVAVSLAMAGTAFAGGMAPAVSEPAAPVVVSDWTGYYVGGSLTGQSGDSVRDLDAGVFAGYRRDFGDFVLGTEAAIVEPRGANNTVGIVDANIGIDAGNLLPYVSAGYAWAKNDEGAVFGLGADYRLGNGVILGGKFTTTDYSAGKSNAFTVRVGFQF